MKVKVKEDVIRECVSRSLSHYGVSPDDIEMPFSASGFVAVHLCRDSASTFRKWYFFIPNDQLALMVHGDKWDGCAADDDFRFGGGGYDPVWFECGVNE